MIYSKNGRTVLGCVVAGCALLGLSLGGCATTEGTASPTASGTPETEIQIASGTESTPDRTNPIEERANRTANRTVDKVDTRTEQATDSAIDRGLDRIFGN